MKLLLAALGRLALVSSTAIGIATAMNLENHRGYWEGTIKNVQTVDFNILANMLPTKLSQALIRQDSEEIQRTLNSNYGLFGLVVTDCTEVIWHCPDQKILYMTESKRSWRDHATVDRLQYHPFDLLRDPPPLRAERGYDNPRDDRWQTTGKTNSGQVIGRVYYVRGIPPSFQQDYLRWLSNPLSTSGAHKFYAMTVGLFLLGGGSVWLLVEWVLSRKRAQQREAIAQQKQAKREIESLHQQLNQQLSEVTLLLEKQEQLTQQMSRNEQVASEQIQQLTAHIAQLQTQVTAKHLNTENLEHQQTVLQQEIEQREQSIIALRRQIDTYAQTASVQTQSLEQLQQQLQADQIKQADAKKRFEESQATIAELKRQLHNQAQDNERAIAQLQTQLEEAKGREQWTSQQRLDAEQEIENLRQQKQSLEQALLDMSNPDLTPFEQAVVDRLQSSPRVQTQRWVIEPSFDVHSKQQSRKFVDVLMSAPSCVVVIEAKNYKGMIQSEGDPPCTKWTSRNGRGELGTVHSVGLNPYKQVNSYMDAVMKKLGTELNRHQVAVYGVVVFAEGADLSAMPSSIGNYCRITTVDRLLSVIEKLESEAALRASNIYPRLSAKQILNKLKGLPVQRSA